MINGYLDDKYSLAPKISIGGPILASLIVIVGGLKIAYITNPSGGVLYLDGLFNWDFIGLAITFLWLMGITYTTKLLDGIDGLTSSIGLIASLVIFGVSMSWDVAGSSTSLLSLALAGSILGFLIFNWHPAKIFLGEAGSTFIGFALGVLSIISGSKIATALLVMGLPVLDIFWVIIKRIKRGQVFWHSDQEHLHFRLLKSGFSQKQIVLFLSAVSLSFGIISIFFTTKIKISALLIVIILMIIFFAPIHLLQLAIGFQVTSVGFPYRFYHSLSTATFTYDFNLIFLNRPGLIGITSTFVLPYCLIICRAACCFLFKEKPILST